MSIVNSQEDVQSSHMFKDTDQKYLCSYATFLLNISHLLKYIPKIYLQWEPWNISHKPQLPSTLPAADRASRERKQHTDSRDFILAAKGLPLISPSYIYCSGWRPEGMPVVVTLSNCTPIIHCVSEQLLGPIMNVEVEREAGRKWLTVQQSCNFINNCMKDDFKRFQWANWSNF